MWRTLIFLAFLLGSVPVSGQTDTPRTVQESIEAQEAAKQARIDAADEALREGRQRHWKNQDRATRRRMRRHYRNSHRMARGRSTPWWRRVLRGIQ